jgi:hypothetical protein
MGIGVKKFIIANVLKMYKTSIGDIYIVKFTDNEFIPFLGMEFSNLNTRFRLSSFRKNDMNEVVNSANTLEIPSSSEWSCMFSGSDMKEINLSVPCKIIGSVAK